MAVFLSFRKDRYSRCLLLGKELICGQNSTALVYNRRAVCACDSCDVIRSQIHSCHIRQIRVKRWCHIFNDKCHDILSIVRLEHNLTKIRSIFQIRKRYPVMIHLR